MVVLAIGDLHAPFQHNKTLEFIKRQIDSLKPDRIVLMGDEVDFHALSRFTKESNAHSSHRELELAIEFMHKLFKAVPSASVCISNHTERYLKRANDVGLPPQVLRNYQELFDAPKAWTWSDEIRIDGVNYIHGEGYSGQHAHFKAAHQLGQSTVIGHIHAHAGVQWINTSKPIFGMNVGCLIDQKAYAFRYSKNNPFKATLGLGVIIDGDFANFIPLR